jgi:Guanine nucleotide exchange factor synembryn
MNDVINNLSQLLTTASSDDHEHFLSFLMQWNDLVELEIQNPPCNDSSSGFTLYLDDDIFDQADTVSRHLLAMLLTQLSGAAFGQNYDGAIENLNECLAISSRVTAKKLRDEYTFDTDGDRDILVESSGLYQILRASQNWLRWCVQVYEPIVVKRKSDTLSTALNTVWRTRDMLEIYFRLVVILSPLAGDMGRFASQLLFYTSYRTSTTWRDDDKIKESYEYLVHTCHFFSEILRVLLQTDQIRLQLSLVKVIHNSCVCFPSLKSSILEATSTVESLPNPAAWISKTTSSMTFKDAFWNMIESQISGSCESPMFPDSKDSRRVELVVEILRIFYALKVGTELTNDLKNVSVVMEILCLDTMDEQCYECQLNLINVLMDTNAHPLSESIVASQKATAVLSFALERQIGVVVDSNITDDRAVPAVVPILVVLNKYCKANSLMRKVLFEHIFPVSAEDTYKKLMTDELAKNNGKAKNMSPLDAPKGSLRWKMIQLLVNPQSFVKRVTGELFWTLCNEDSQQFIFRVGMGNALPFLGIKGVLPVTMPI